ncbi:hypothetical protein [Halobacillus andaensis]|uniref:hypothetical protein n=1 Tax=Halobacillus andaensis TaxID=1176239 RepID=UPI003D702A53
MKNKWNRASKQDIEWMGLAVLLMSVFFGTILLTGTLSGVKWMEVLPDFSRSFVNVEVFRDLINLREG